MVTNSRTNSANEVQMHSTFVWTEALNFRLAISAVTLLRRETKYTQWLVDGEFSPGKFELLATSLGITQEECEEQWQIIAPQYQHIIDHPTQFSIRDITYQGKRLTYLDLVPELFTEYMAIEPVYFCRNCGYQMHDMENVVHDTQVCGDQWDFDPELRLCDMSSIQIM